MEKYGLKDKRLQAPGTLTQMVQKQQQQVYETAVTAGIDFYDPWYMGVWDANSVNRTATGSVGGGGATLHSSRITGNVDHKCSLSPQLSFIQTVAKPNDADGATQKATRWNLMCFNATPVTAAAAAALAQTDIRPGVFNEHQNSSHLESTVIIPAATAPVAASCNSVSEHNLKEDAVLPAKMPHRILSPQEQKMLRLMRGQHTTDQNPTNHANQTKQTGFAPRRFESSIPQTIKSVNKPCVRRQSAGISSSGSNHAKPNSAVSNKQTKVPTSASIGTTQKKIKERNTAFAQYGIKTSGQKVPPAAYTRKTVTTNAMNSKRIQQRRGVTSRTGHSTSGDHTVKSAAQKALKTSRPNSSEAERRRRRQQQRRVQNDSSVSSSDNNNANTTKAWNKSQTEVLKLLTKLIKQDPDMVEDLLKLHRAKASDSDKQNNNKPWKSRDKKRQIKQESGIAMTRTKINKDSADAINVVTADEAEKLNACNNMQDENESANNLKGKENQSNRIQSDVSVTAVKAESNKTSSQVVETVAERNDDSISGDALCDDNKSMHFNDDDDDDDNNNIADNIAEEAVMFGNMLRRMQSQLLRRMMFSRNAEDDADVSRSSSNNSTLASVDNTSTTQCVENDTENSNGQAGSGLVQYMTNVSTVALNEDQTGAKQPQQSPVSQETVIANRTLSQIQKQLIEKALSGSNANDCTHNGAVSGENTGASPEYNSTATVTESKDAKMITAAAAAADIAAVVKSAVQSGSAMDATTTETCKPATGTMNISANEVSTDQQLSSVCGEDWGVDESSAISRTISLADNSHCSDTGFKSVEDIVLSVAKNVEDFCDIAEFVDAETIDDMEFVETNLMMGELQQYKTRISNGSNKVSNASLDQWQQLVQQNIVDNIGSGEPDDAQQKTVKPAQQQQTTRKCLPDTDSQCHVMNPRAAPPSLITDTFIIQHVDPWTYDNP